MSSSSEKPNNSSLTQLCRDFCATKIGRKLGATVHKTRRTSFYVELGELDAFLFPEQDITSLYHVVLRELAKHGEVCITYSWSLMYYDSDGGLTAACGPTLTEALMRLVVAVDGGKE